MTRYQYFMNSVCWTLSAWLFQLAAWVCPCRTVVHVLDWEEPEPDVNTFDESPGSFDDNDFPPL
jgi:hypothetical protein